MAYILRNGFELIELLYTIEPFSFSEASQNTVEIGNMERSFVGEPLRLGPFYSWPSEGVTS